MTSTRTDEKVTPMTVDSQRYPLYRPELEHDACGIVLAADVYGRASHALVARALVALSRLTHRGADGGDTGVVDGAGLLTAIPWRLIAPDLRVSGSRAVGMFLVPAPAREAARTLIERHARDLGWIPATWRSVPTCADALDARSRATVPAYEQLVLVSVRSHAAADVDLLRLRVRILHDAARAGLTGFAVASLSQRTIVYKGLVSPPHLPVFFPDLRDARFSSAMAVAHQRFSTNTLARWDLAQPFHLIAHNGEINTISGNRQWMRARQRDERALAGWSGEAGELVPTSGSDSESLDAALGTLVASGVDLPLALTRLVPPAWEQDPHLTDEERAFYACQAAVSEPWDGPAALAFSDGRASGFCLDRNGFRPTRYVETRDGQVYAGSESGLFDPAPGDILCHGRLGPGQMIVIDHEAQTIRRGDDVRRALAEARPYGQFAARIATAVPARASVPFAGSPAELLPLQHLFGVDREEMELIIRSLAVDGKESVGSMGDDTPPAVLSSRPRLVSDFFRQRFAQVTNPPMDALRERAVMSLKTWLGPRGEFTSLDGGNTRLLALESPILSDATLDALRQQADGRIVRLPLTFPVVDGAAGLRAALDRLTTQGVDAVAHGAGVLVLSDRSANAEYAPIPALLAVGALHQRLTAEGCRLQASIVVESGDARDPHHIAALLAHGAAAVVPYLGFRLACASGPDEDPLAVAQRYQASVEEGLLKIFSKMGVSTLSGYCGAQLFEILGLARDVVDTCFPRTVHVLGGATFDRLGRDVLDRHAQAYGTDKPLKHFGFHGFRRDGDYHAFNPAIVRRLHQAVGTATESAYQDFSTLVHQRAPMDVRDLLHFAPRTPVPLDDVESVEQICRRFFASAMSVGALGPEAHRVLAMAMNRMGARSNSGEGGEETERFFPRRGYASANSSTKQVASGRFGVTPAYLISASELQIKMAQGSKPGEGGQLPAAKVVDHIARLRYAQPLTSLISPPPHHDIYSIEDLAQLIYDLRAFHPAARINVKLVSQIGVGIVAAGVVKAGANAIQLSGHSGGTGASPRGSIKHAGLPWEIGLAETQQVLTLNGLRGRVVLQADGGFKTGRDVAIAAALGADEYGFGTAALVAIGCLMARQCHLNTCPVGIATQRPDLRAKFAGTPEQAIAYFRLVAEDVRRILASLGLRSMRELIGRADLLEARPDVGETSIDLAPILVRCTPDQAASGAMERRRSSLAGAPQETLNDRLVRMFGERLGLEALEWRGEVRNTDRTVGAALSGLAAERFGDAGLPCPVKLTLTGSAGQSFGAFLLPGMHLSVTGDANDFVGKGLHGGEIVIKPARGQHDPRPVLAANPVLVGNSVLYGATGGRLFVAGRAGERFAVRNSGAVAVVEGVGEHGCEYMTGGAVVILGSVGRNFAAGMTGGLAYVFDPDDRLAAHCNMEHVEIHAFQDDDRRLLQLLAEHQDVTGSEIARAVCREWSRLRKAFKVVRPKGAEIASRGPEPERREEIEPASPVLTGASEQAAWA